MRVGFKHTEESKQKMREANLGKKPWNKGKHLSKEAKRKMRLAHIGIKFSEKHKENIRKGHIGLHTGSKHPRWKGGQSKTGEGYIIIKKPEHPRVNNQGYVKRCILVMEKKIGRYVVLPEVVHHKNGIKDDDRPENLELFINNSKHNRFHRLQDWKNYKRNKLGQFIPVCGL